MKKLNKAKAIKLIALIITIAILIIATIYMIPVIKQINTPEGQAEFKEKITNSGITGMLILFGYFFFWKKFIYKVSSIFFYKEIYHCCYYEY